MRAVVFERPDRNPASTVIKDVQMPSAGTGQVVVKVAYAGLNYADLMMRTGIYPHPKGYPLVAGLELAGTVTDIGANVIDIAVGDRVTAFSEDAGAFAEYCAVPIERIVRLPDGVAFDVGAAFYVQALTAWNLLHTVSETKLGDTILIHAIGGGVGLYLTQLAKAAGAQVVGTIGTAGKEKRALEFGADLVIDRTDTDFVEATLAFTNGRGVDKVVDSTGATILDKSFETIRQLGHVVSFGEAEGPPLPNLWEQLIKKSLTFTRMHLGHMDFGSETWSKGVETVLSMIMDGTLACPIEGVYELENVNDMFTALASRKLAGKAILKVS
ncbi:zinc-binding dehydrogenase [Roseobacter sp.]|uniref:zinc-binding dehydrogenase n=1 Tax=Roseobacter sp. TaxID=1907202 RepID=UPI00385A1D9B